MRFRWNRRELDESLATTVELDATADALQAYVDANCDYARGQVSVIHVGWDDRCGWDTHRVCIGGMAIGDCDQMPAGAHPTARFSGRWKANWLGETPREAYEIAVVRSDNAHGLQSWGWGGYDKLIIASDHGDVVPVWVRNMQYDLAEKVAHQLNEGGCTMPAACPATLVGPAGAGFDKERS